jgi:hypothetical protein
MMIRTAALLLFAFSLSAQSAARYDVRIIPGADTPNGRSTVTAEVFAVTPAADPELIHLSFLSVGLESFTATGMTCTFAAPAVLDCAVTPMAAGGKATLHAILQPSSTLGAFTALSWKERGQRTERRVRERDLYRYTHEFAVTNTADSGAGSLRQALLDANAACTLSDACRIHFDLPPNTSIRPLTALPRIAAREIVIDGGAGILLDGSASTGPNGLEIGAQSHTILRKLKVHSFPNAGVEATPEAAVKIHECEIVHNASRGVAAFDAFVAVYDSVLSGNLRSGLFIDGGGGRVHNSLIGVAPDGVTAMPNLASGIFVNGRGDVYIADNVIAHNAHFGVAYPASSERVEVGPNRIFGNGGPPIDVNLDGPSFFAQTPGAWFNGPLLTSATYDAATNTTTISGRLDTDQFVPFIIAFEIQFFTTAPNGTDQFLGAITITSPDFVFTARGDLRGRSVVANAIRYRFDELTQRSTSEFGTSIAVQ